MHTRINFLLYSAFLAIHFVVVPSIAGLPSIIFPVTGNVYPQGHYYVEMNIGNPPKPYFLDIDTGSDLTWVQCDAPCQNCLPAPHPPYKPGEVVKCNDPLCLALHWPDEPVCASTEQCDYNVQYADHGSSSGVLVKDTFQLQFSNGTVTQPRVAFGCGFDQRIPDGATLPNVDGVLGLGLGKVGILRQLEEAGVTENTVGHCLSSQGDGYLFFGKDVLAINWMPYTEMENHYSLGAVELYYGEKTSGMNGLTILFDSGSTYTYLAREAYEVTLSLIKNDIEGKQLNRADDDNTLPICWAGIGPFNSIQDVKNLFKPVILRFEGKVAGFQIEPEGYLIITERGNVCLGILNGTEAGLGDLNLIGDISFQDKLIVYDNDMKEIGWAPADCSKVL